MPTDEEIHDQAIRNVKDCGHFKKLVVCETCNRKVIIEAIRLARAEGFKEGVQKTRQELVEEAVSILFNVFLDSCSECSPATRDDTACLCGKHEELLLSFQEELKKEKVNENAK